MKLTGLIIVTRLPSARWPAGESQATLWSARPGHRKCARWLIQYRVNIWPRLDRRSDEFRLITASWSAGRPAKIASCFLWPGRRADCTSCRRLIERPAQVGARNQFAGPSANSGEFIIIRCGRLIKAGLGDLAAQLGPRTTTMAAATAATTSGPNERPANELKARRAA